MITSQTVILVVTPKRYTAQHIILVNQYYICSEPRFYAGKFPMCGNFTENLQPTEVFDIVLNTGVSSEVVCTQKPVGVKDAAVFVVDTTSFRRHDDLKADDMGSWVHKGKPVRYYEISRLTSGEVYGAKPCNASNSSTVYKLTRIYYHHGGTPEFRKTIFYVHGKSKNIMHLRAQGSRQSY